MCVCVCVCVCHSVICEGVCVCPRVCSVTFPFDVKRGLSQQNNDIMKEACTTQTQKFPYTDIHAHLPWQQIMMQLQILLSSSCTPPFLFASTSSLPSTLNTTTTGNTSSEISVVSGVGVIEIDRRQVGADTESKRDRERDTHTHTHTHVLCMHLGTCIYVR